ncbi:hypothetical protein HDE_02775 [Halotydeus destructor]|nr:hypothetical protein HDE_02775 [Halotydeus destructor]
MTSTPKFSALKRFKTEYSKPVEQYWLSNQEIVELMATDRKLMSSLVDAFRHDKQKFHNLMKRAVENNQLVRAKRVQMEEYRKCVESQNKTKDDINRMMELDNQIMEKIINITDLIEQIQSFPRVAINI